MRQIIIALTSILILSGCSKTEDWQRVNKTMNFSVIHPAATRATSTSFESGDKIGVYVTQYNGETLVPLQVSGNYANNSAVVFDGFQWTVTPKIYWAEGKFDVYAYYPYAKPTSVDEYQFSVALDQSTIKSDNTLSGYEASDFLWAKNTGIAQMTSVPLTFKHKMSKLVVNLVKGAEYEGDIPTDAVVRIHNTVIDATIDLSTGTVTRNGYEVAKSITANKVSDGVYTAIVIPQRIDTKRPLIEVLSKGVSYLIESSFVFKAGVQHTITITLNNNPDKVAIEIGGEIEGGWE